MRTKRASSDYRETDRRQTRVVLEARAHGTSAPVQLYDVSLTGCRIDRSTLDLVGADRISFQFADSITVSGKVAWLRGDMAGVQFTSPLPDSIARHLQPAGDADE